MNYDELRQKIKWERSKGATFDVFLFDDVERLLDKIEALRAALADIASTAGPTAKWARDIAEQALVRAGMPEATPE